MLMTEKDAVKCRAFAPEDWWYVPVSAQLDPAFEEDLLKRLATVAMAKGIRRDAFGRRVGGSGQPRPPPPIDER